MAKQIDPRSIIGNKTSAFGPGHFWEVVDYDPESDEYLLRLTDGNGNHPVHPHKLKPEACETKRVPRYQLGM